MLTTVKTHVLLRALALTVLAAAVTLPLRNHENIRGPLDLTLRNADTLSRTLVVPQMQQPIVPNRNVVWSAAFQLAWNDLTRPLAPPLTVLPPNHDVSVLNEHAMDTRDVPAAFVLAGVLRSPYDLEQMHEKIETSPEFHKRTHARELDKLEPHMESLDGMAVYGHLCHRIQFDRTMNRMAAHPIDFMGTDVVAFGFSQDAEDDLARRQTTVHDYVSPDDFVLELDISDPCDSLILAKVEPEHTLAQTVAATLARMRDSAGAPHAGTLKIPTLNLELEQEFMRIEGTVLGPNEGAPARIAYAGQTVRVRLDERGVASSHPADQVKGEDSDGPACVFDRPFLLMLKLRSSELPYLVLWVGHPELLLEAN